MSRQEYTEDMYAKISSLSIISGAYDGRPSSEYRVSNSERSSFSIKEFKIRTGALGGINSPRSRGKRELREFL